MTVKKNMPIGVTDFKKVREGYYFVDKTDFIRQFIDGHSEATLITRPRRFGKTLFLSMMDWFFSIDKRDESEGLFDGLDIACAGSSYMAERGTRPVIFLSLKGIEADTWAYARKIYEMRISDLYRSFPYLWTSGKLNEYDKKRGQKIAGGVADEVEYQDGLSALSRLLTAYHGAKPVMLIDEYDAPLQYAYQHGYYDDAVVYFRTCFNAAFKDNPYLDFAIITGVLRVAKESIFSGLNSLDVCSVTTEKYRESCGFTQAEIDKMASDLGFEKKIDEIKEWYDGYHFGDAGIYNPWSVISYVSEGFAARPYWTNTSSNVILRKLLARLDHVRIKELRGLMSGGCVRASINESMIYESIGKNDTDLYNVLLTTGYLTTEKDSTKNERRMTRMTIPNKEIEQVYATEILDAITPNLRSDDFFRALECMLDGYAEDFEYLLQRLIEQMASTFDTSEGKQEIFYHGLMLGLTATLHGNGYQVKSEGKSGYGRFDVAIFPMNTENAGVVMEFKTAKKDEDLNKVAENAAAQIKEKKYMAEFEARGVNDVWCYGIGFCCKKIKIIRA